MLFCCLCGVCSWQCLSGSHLAIRGTLVGVRLSHLRAHGWLAPCFPEAAPPIPRPEGRPVPDGLQPLGDLSSA